MSLEHLFTYRPADDESVDPEYELIANPAFSVQVFAWDGAIDYVVNENGYDDPEKQSGFWLKNHGSFPTLEKAMAHTITVSSQEGSGH